MTHINPDGGPGKTATGIQGFDDITGGGLPQGRTTLLLGGPGSGKTVFALQMLVNGAHENEPGILVTFQDSPQQVVENAASFGLNFAELEKRKLVFLDARIRPNIVKSIDLYLRGMLAAIKVVANEIGAKRIVFDSLEALLSVLAGEAARRNEILRLRDWLMESGITAIIATQAEGEGPSPPQREDSLQSMADCVVCLKRPAGDPAAPRTLRVLKCCDSGFVKGEIPFVIGAMGFEVGRPPADAHVPAGKGPAGIVREIALTQEDFQARIKSIKHQLEIRKAELDFLMRSQAGKKTGAPGAGCRPLAKSAGQLKVRKTKPPNFRKR